MPVITPAAATDEKLRPLRSSSFSRTCSANQCAVIIWARCKLDIFLLSLSLWLSLSLSLSLLLFLFLFLSLFLTHTLCGDFTFCRLGAGLPSSRGRSELALLVLISIHGYRFICVNKWTLRVPLLSSNLLHCSRRVSNVRACRERARERERKRNRERERDREGGRETI